jgi:hypothetical protein
VSGVLKCPGWKQAKMVHVEKLKAVRRFEKVLIWVLLDGIVSPPPGHVVGYVLAALVLDFSGGARMWLQLEGGRPAASVAEAGCGRHQ